jgi:DNA repair protein RecO (recombination protein O)
MKEEKSEGIVLRSLDFKERQKIITVFTLESGVISLIFKSAAGSFVPLTTPFCHAEFIYTKGRGDLFRFQDGSLIDPHLKLRQGLRHLNAAGELTNLIYTSQLPGAPSPVLYSLFLSFFKQIPSFEDPTALILSFRLKMLKVEGRLALTSHCSHCSKAALILQKGESLCPAHAPSHLHRFSPDHWEILHKLAHARNFDELRFCLTDKILKEKLIDQLGAAT